MEPALNVNLTTDEYTLLMMLLEANGAEGNMSAEDLANKLFLAHEKQSHDTETA